MDNNQLPENIEEIRKFARDNNLDVKYLLGEKYKGDLHLFSARSLPANIQFNVGGYLWLSSVRSLPENIIFNVGSFLNLNSVKSLSDNVLFNVGRDFNLTSVQSLLVNTKFNVDGNIYLPMEHKVKVIWN